MEFDIQYWHWIVFGIALILSEIVIASFFVLWFGAAAVVVGGLLFLFPGMSPAWQIFIWTILSSGLAFVWFKYLKHMSPDNTKAGLSKESIVGEIGQVLSLPTKHKRGNLRFPAPVLGSDEWHFICDEDVAIGDRVTVSDVSGNTLIVKKI